MSRLGLQILRDDVLIADWSGRCESLATSTDKHGFGTLSGRVAMATTEAMAWYSTLAAVPRIVASDGIITAFDGRLEDVAIVEGGLQFVAFGYWSALADIPYTALWSTTLYGEWDEHENGDIYATENNNDKFALDNNNRVYLAPQHGEWYNSGDYGAMVYLRPDDSETYIETISFDWTLDIDTNWQAYLISATSASQSASSLATGDGTEQTGSSSVSLPASTIAVGFQLLRTGGVDYQYPDETGAQYFKATSFRIKGTDSSTVEGDEIAEALVAHVRAVNADQLSADTSMIRSPGIDYQDYVFGDHWPADILTGLASRGDDSDPANLYEAGVWEDKRVHLRQRGSRGRTWFVDVDTLTIESTISTLWNSAYTVYRDELRRIIRTGTNSSAGSVARYGITRRQFLDSRTTSESEAESVRDAYITEYYNVTPRTDLELRNVYSASGVPIPLYLIRAGDSVEIRNLPALVPASVNRVRRMLVVETDYNVMADELRLKLEISTPSLDDLIVEAVVTGQQAQNTINGILS